MAEEQEEKSDISPDIAKKTINDEFEVSSYALEGINKALEKANKNLRARGLKELKLTEISRRTEKIYPPNWDVSQPLDTPLRIVVIHKVKIEGEVPEIHDYEFIAKIEHTEAGNIINMNPSIPVEKLPAEYKTSNQRCDICKTNRERNNTFIIKKLETGEFISAGSTCLKKFMPLDAVKAFLELAVQLEVMRNLLVNAEASPDEDERDGDRNEKIQPYFDPEDFLIWVCIAYLSKGKKYISNKKAKEWSTEGNTVQSTLDTVYHLMSPIYGYSGAEEAERERQRIISRYKSEAIDMSKKIYEWIQTQDFDQMAIDNPSMENYFNTMKVLAKLPYVQWRNAGYYSSFLALYLRATKPKVEPGTEKKQSEFVGKVGDKIELNVTLKSVKGYDSQYGWVNIYNLEDENGNKLVWFSASSAPGFWDEETQKNREGEKFKIKGTVKNQQVSKYNNQKETVLTRVKVLNQLEEQELKNLKKHMAKFPYSAFKLPDGTILSVDKHAMSQYHPHGALWAPAISHYLGQKIDDNGATRLDKEFWNKKGGKKSILPDTTYKKLEQFYMDMGLLPGSKKTIQRGWSDGSSTFISDEEVEDIYSHAYEKDYGIKPKKFEQVENEKKPKLVMAIGVSGSGKSSYIKKHYHPDTIITPDEIRKQMTGDISNHTMEPQVWSEVSRRVAQSLKDNNIAVLDATNVDSGLRLKFLKNYPSAEKIALVFKVDPEVAKTRIAKDLEKGTDRSRVPSSVVDKQYKKLMAGYGNLPQQFDKIEYIGESKMQEQVDDEYTIEQIKEILKYAIPKLKAHINDGSFRSTLQKFTDWGFWQGPVYASIDARIAREILNSIFENLEYLQPPDIEEIFNKLEHFIFAYNLYPQNMQEVEGEHSSNTIFTEPNKKRIPNANVGGELPEAKKGQGNLHGDERTQKQFVIDLAKSKKDGLQTISISEIAAALHVPNKMISGTYARLIRYFNDRPNLFRMVIPGEPFRQEAIYQYIGEEPKKYLTADDIEAKAAEQKERELFKTLKTGKYYFVYRDRDGENVGVQLHLKAWENPEDVKLTDGFRLGEDYEIKEYIRSTVFTLDQLDALNAALKRIQNVGTIHEMVLRKKIRQMVIESIKEIYKERGKNKNK